jgi:hypothetical protein
MKPMQQALSMSAIALTITAGGQALAQEIPTSEDQAKALEKQVHDVMADITAGIIPLPVRPIELVPEGDHYLVRIPLNNFGHIQPADAALTARARMLDTTRWAFDDQQLPSPLTFTIKETVPDAPDAKNPSPNGSHEEAVTYNIKLGQQDSHGVFDPTFTTPANSSSTITSIDFTRTGGTMPNAVHVKNVISQTSSRPVDAHHVDLLSDTTTEDYVAESEMPDGTTFKMSTQKFHVVSAVTGLAQEKLVPLIHLGISIFKTAPTEAGPKQDEAAKADLRKLIVAANSLLTGAHIDETLDGVKVDFGTHSGSIDKFEFALGGDAPQDMLSATMNFVMDGLTIPELAPAFAAYLPTHIAVRPVISNVSVADLTKIGMDSTEPGASAPSPAAFQTLFSHGGINIGFDSLGLDIAGTKFAGTGKFTMAGPQTVTGEAEVTAHGLDAFITKAQADPMLAKGVPMIIFLKGIAHTAADEAVWQISVANKKVLVNGVDLSAMAGAMK